MSWPIGQNRIWGGWMGGSKKNSKNPRTCINGMFPKGPPTHGHPCPNMVHQKILQCQCSSEGQVVACPGRGYGMVTTDLATSDSCMLQMEMAASPDPALVSSLLHPDTEDTWHQWHLKPWQFWQKQCLAVLPSTVQCMTTEKLSLQWEDMAKPLLKS